MNSSRTRFLIFGESVNDTDALEHLIFALTPSKFAATVKKLRNPTVLAKRTDGRKRGSMSALVKTVERQETKAGIKVIVIAHRDCDAIEPAHVANAAALEQDLRNAGIANPVAATPAWCMESWWMQFADEVHQVRKCWKRLNYGNSSVGKIPRAKERLARDLTPPKSEGRCPEFCESDGIAIAKRLRETGSARMPAELSSKSLEAFRVKLNAAVSLCS